VKRRRPQRGTSLEAENRRLKGLLAAVHLDNAALKDLLAKMYGPPASPG
jgi:putative transposase